jgi:hypothetical protein
LHDAPSPNAPHEIEHYVEAWSQRGAAARMIAYYRASAKALEERFEMDIFSPVRQNWLDKTDAYLRRGAVPPTES